MTPQAYNYWLGNKLMIPPVASPAAPPPIAGQPVPTLSGQIIPPGLLNDIGGASNAGQQAPNSSGVSPNAGMTPAGVNPMGGFTSIGYDPNPTIGRTLAVLGPIGLAARIGAEQMGLMDTGLGIAGVQGIGNASITGIPGMEGISDPGIGVGGVPGVDMGNVSIGGIPGAEGVSDPGAPGGVDPGVAGPGVDGSWRYGGPVPSDHDRKLEPVRGILHEGEYVVRPEMTKIHRGLLEKINKGKVSKKKARSLLD